MIRQHIIFSGRVQGVGFRYRAVNAARMYRVGGWVRNLPDGRVEAELEGTEDSISQVILAVERGTYVCIDNMWVRNIPATGETSFYVKDEE